MNPTTTLLTADRSSTDGLSFTTASVSPAEKRFLTAFIDHATTGGTSISDVIGLGLEWHHVVTVAISGTTKLELWVAKTEQGFSTSGTITIQMAATTQSCNWHFHQTVDHYHDGPIRAGNVKTATGTGTAASLAFDPAQMPTDRMLVGYGASANITQLPRANWTELADTAITGPSVALQTQWRPDAVETTSSSTLSGSAAWGAIGIEIVAAEIGGSVAVQSRNVMDRLISHAMSTGHFEEESMHEPDNAPASGVACALWVDGIRPVPAGSGLAMTCAVLDFKMRLYTSAASEPKDEIDPLIVDATDALMTAYSSDFTLDGAIRNIDLLGQVSQGLRAQAGYVNSQEMVYRVMTLDIPVIINDAWSQVP